MTDTYDPEAPIVPYAAAPTDSRTADAVSTDGGERRSSTPPFDRPPRTEHATEYTRDCEEIEPLVADLR